MEIDHKGTILIVDDIPANIIVLLDYLSEKGFRILVAEDGESAIEQIQYIKPDLILLDIMMPGINGFETCRRIKENPLTKDIPIIFMSSLTDTVDKIKGFNIGAIDYITKPIQHEEVLARVNTHITLRRLQKQLEENNLLLEKKVEERTAELSKALSELEDLKNKLVAENIYLQEEIKVNNNFDFIISESPQVKTVLKKIAQVSATDTTVLVLGETGTGKELFSRAIHNTSQRKEQSLVRVNCASLPANLIESELFGHEKGAFTGALTRKIGRFELANGGTIFLDEIGDLPLELQAKLLRVLQEGEFERLGNPNTIQVDVRIIAATNRNLENAILKGDFRQDLYYRLNVFPINLPPLRERDGDIPLLAKFFVKKYCKKIGKEINIIPQNIFEMLENYSWPGNVRELENVIERGVILSENNVLSIDNSLIQSNNKNDNLIVNNNRLDSVEREHIIKTLQESNWIISGNRGAAIKLGIPPSTLRDKMKKLNIERPK